jgi:Tfp pilus assembly protein PilE
MNFKASAQVLVAGVLSVSALAVRAMPAHPRLILTSDRAAAMRAFVANDSTAEAYYNATYLQGEWVLSRPPDGPVISNTSTPDARYLLQKIYALGVLYAITGEPAYAAWGAEEAVNGALASQWDVNGTVQLNTGEMLHAVGMGFDWFYDSMNASQRAIVVEGMVTKGLSRLLEALTADPPPSWATAFVNTSSNWATVILGGGVMGCLAVAGEPGAPAWVNATLLPAALTAMRLSVSGWGPDGGWQ